MKLLREYIKTLIEQSQAEALTEITKLPTAYFTEIDNAITNSRFWEKPNTPDEIDYSDTQRVLATPAADALQSSIKDTFNKLDLDIDILVRSHDTDDPGMMLHPEHPAYPNRWIIDATWSVSKQNPGRNTIDIEIMVSKDPILDLDSNALVRHIAQTVRHELVHYSQMKKQGINKNLNDTDAFEEMLNDPKQIPDNEIGTVQDYLSSHIEIDAHAHDGAEELIAVYGKEGALDVIRGGVDLSDPKLPNALQHYYEVLPAGDETIKKLHKKIFKYIEYFSKS
jgi:hypothetical protein